MASSPDGAPVGIGYPASAPPQPAPAVTEKKVGAFQVVIQKWSTEDAGSAAAERLVPRFRALNVATTNGGAGGSAGKSDPAAGRGPRDAGAGAARSTKAAQKQSKKAKAKGTNEVRNRTPKSAGFVESRLLNSTLNPKDASNTPATGPVNELDSTAAEPGQADSSRILAAEFPAKTGKDGKAPEPVSEVSTEPPPLEPPRIFTYDFEVTFHRTRVEAWYRYIALSGALASKKWAKSLTPETRHLIAYTIHYLRLNGRQYLLRLHSAVGYTGTWKEYGDLLSKAPLNLFRVRIPNGRLVNETDAALCRVEVGSVLDPTGADYEVDIPRPLGASPIDTLIQHARRVVWEAGGLATAGRLESEFASGFPCQGRVWKDAMKAQDLTISAPTICELRSDLFELHEATRNDAPMRRMRAKYVVLVDTADEEPAADAENEAAQFLARISDVFGPSRLVVSLEELAVRVLPVFQEGSELPFPQKGLLNFLLKHSDEYVVVDRASGVDAPYYMVAKISGFAEPGVEAHETVLEQHQLGAIPAFLRLVEFIGRIVKEKGGSTPLSYLVLSAKAPDSGAKGRLADALLELVGGWEQLCRTLDEAGLFHLAYHEGPNGKPVAIITSPDYAASATPESHQVLELTAEYVQLVEREIAAHLASTLPKRGDLEVRQQVLDTIQRAVRRAWGNGISVFAFGSTANGLGTAHDDLDICIVTEQFGAAAQGPWVNMFALAKILKFCGFSEVVPIAHARVPIVKLKYRTRFGHEIAADVNVNNNVALWNTRLLRTYCLLDPRVRPFLMAVKLWSKRRGVNGSSEGWFSSYSFVLMGLAFLVMRDVVPCLQKAEDARIKRFCETVVPGSAKLPRMRGKNAANGIQPLSVEVDVTFKDYTEFCEPAVVAEGGTRMVPPGLTGMLAMLEEDRRDLRYVSGNTESLASLLRGFFATFSNFDRRHLAVSLRDGGFIPRTGKRFKGDALVVEDPFIEHNTTRNAGERVCAKLMVELRRAANLTMAARSFTEVCEFVERERL